MRLMDIAGTQWKIVFRKYRNAVFDISQQSQIIPKLQTYIFLITCFFLIFLRFKFPYQPNILVFKAGVSAVKTFTQYCVFVKQLGKK